MFSQVHYHKSDNRKIPGISCSNTDRFLENHLNKVLVDHRNWGMEKPLFQELAIIFSNQIIKICHELDFRKLRAISGQLIRSGTAIGALVAEASEAESADDFIHKMKIAAKEARESSYWLQIAATKVMVPGEVFEHLTSMQKIITKSIQTATQNRQAKRNRGSR